MVTRRGVDVGDAEGCLNSGEMDLNEKERSLGKRDIASVNEEHVGL